MSPALQAKLLQVLQDGEYTRLGGNREVRVDVRVVCATNRTLEQMVAQGTFREDLYFRLNVVGIEIPLRCASGGRSCRPWWIPSCAATAPATTSACGRSPSAWWKRSSATSSPATFASWRTSSSASWCSKARSRSRRICWGPNVGAPSQATRFEQLLDELEEQAGQVPLREVGRRAALEAERNTIERVLHQTGWNRKKAAELL